MHFNPRGVRWMGWIEILPDYIGLLLIFSAFYVEKKTHVLAVFVCLWANFLANHETHRTKIFSVAPSIHMLESNQIWFISDKALGLNKKTLKTEPHKADEITRSLYSIIMSIYNLYTIGQLYDNLYYADADTSSAHVYLTAVITTRHWQCTRKKAPHESYLA